MSSTVVYDPLVRKKKKNVLRTLTKKHKQDTNILVSRLVFFTHFKRNCFYAP